jgi:hypothetical protein
MYNKKLKLYEDVNGNTFYSVLERINIDLIYSKIDIVYSNFLRFPNGDIKIVDKNLGGSFPFSHVDGVAFKDKNGDIIPVYDANGDVVLEDGEPKQRLADFTKYINVLDPIFGNEIARGIFRVEALDIPSDFIYLV